MATLPNASFFDTTPANSFRHNPPGASRGMISFEDISTNEGIHHECPIKPRPRSVRPDKEENFARNFSFRTIESPTEIDDAALHSFIYRNGSLSLNNLTTLDEMTKMMCVTRMIRKFYIVSNRPLEAAVANLWVVRHRVLILDEKASRRCKLRAIKSFPNDIAGNWCFPGGDLLIFPGFHKSVDYLVETLQELHRGVKLASKLNGDATRGNLTISKEMANHSRYQSDASSYSILMSEEEFRINAIFKPVFSGQYYLMGGPKQRILAELYQATILVFFKLADWALFHEDLGTATYFLQQMQLAVTTLQNILPFNEKFNRTYLVTVGNYLVGRCFYALHRNFSRLGKTVRDYSRIKHKMSGFVFMFYIVYPDYMNRVSKPYDCLDTFPETDVDCLRIARAAYFEVSFPSKWYRALYEKESVDIKWRLFQIRKWAESLSTPAERVDLDLKGLQLGMIIDDVEEMRNRACGCLHVKILADCIAAKCARMSIGMDISRKVEHFIHWRDAGVDARDLKYRSFTQRDALSLMNCETDAVLKHPIHAEIRAKLAAKTLFDEVILVFESQHRKPKFWNGAEMLLNLLPKVFYCWRSFDMANEDWEHLHPTLAMFFYGLARAFHILNRYEYDERLQRNLEFCSAMAARLTKEDKPFMKVFEAFLDHAVCVERCLFYGSSVSLMGPGPKKFVKQKCTRALQVLRRLTWLLPLLDERLLHQYAHGMMPTYFKVVVRTENLVRPEFIDCIPYLTGEDKTIFNDFIKFVGNLINFKPNPRDGFAVIRHPATQKASTTCDVQMEPFPVIPSRDNFFSFHSRETYDQQTPVGGVIERGSYVYPLESYYEEEEKRSVWLMPSLDNMYSEIFHDFNHGVNKPRSRLESRHLFLRAKSVLLDMIEKAMIDLRNIEKDKEQSSAIEELVLLMNEEEPVHENGYAKHLRPRFLISEFSILYENLKVDHPSLNHAVTRTIFKLDELLNQAEFRELLRDVAPVPPAV